MAIELRIHWLHRLVARWPLQDQRDAVPQLVGQDLIGIILRLVGWLGWRCPTDFRGGFGKWVLVDC